MIWIQFVTSFTMADKNTPVRTLPSKKNVVTRSFNLFQREKPLFDSYFPVNPALSSFVSRLAERRLFYPANKSSPRIIRSLVTLCRRCTTILANIKLRRDVLRLSLLFISKQIHNRCPYKFCTRNFAKKSIALYHAISLFAPLGVKPSEILLIDGKFRCERDKLYREILER